MLKLINKLYKKWIGCNTTHFLSVCLCVCFLRPVSHPCSSSQESIILHSSHASASSMETSHWLGSLCACKLMLPSFSLVVRDLNAMGVFRGRLWSPSAFHSTLNLIHKKQHHWQKQQRKGEGGIAPALCRKNPPKHQWERGGRSKQGGKQVCTCILNRKEMIYNIVSLIIKRYKKAYGCFSSHTNSQNVVNNILIHAFMLHG